MPSFSSRRSLIRSMESPGSMSISISLPVRVFTLIICSDEGGKEAGGGCQQARAVTETE
jgi:hypothetical protein